jgi:hypothetical protein
MAAANTADGRLEDREFSFRSGTGKMGVREEYLGQ